MAEGSFFRTKDVLLNENDIMRNYSNQNLAVYNDQLNESHLRRKRFENTVNVPLS